MPFFDSTSALSLQWRGRDLVNCSMRSFSSRRATWWLMYSEPLSACKPRISNGKASSRPSSTGSRKLSAIRSTLPTN